MRSRGVVVKQSGFGLVEKLNCCFVVVGGLLREEVDGLVVDDQSTLNVSVL